MQYVHNSIIILISGLLGCNIHYCTDLPPVLLKRLGDICQRSPKGWTLGVAKGVGQQRVWPRGYGQEGGS